ncbi:hypothetical protein [Paraburkholderia acidisoli]|uniref:Uncharacterized protein n=1 Tax=Paraburkholderia acidisoli TaxID=2571748 RepID=A0A7Z2GH28_9BURK|nr:hypothetical protein [Paraburkholderia acidisoli]QGZ61682.1 hypothetical protein FAZ98_08000 [Paraburkholderia acidisoli]
MSHSIAAHDPQLDAQLCAFNSAFAELGLRFRWDAQTLNALASLHGEQARVAAYIEMHHAHLLKAYTMEFLCEAILARKNAQAPGEWPLARGTTYAANATQGWHEAGLPALAGA